MRKHFRGEIELAPGEMDACISLISRHRASFAPALVTGNNSLRSMLRTLGTEGQVTQRLKRLNTILEKVTARETTLSLDRMQDIGGLRVVVPHLDDAYRLAERVGRYRDVREVVDYVKQPRSSGYRCLHLITDYGSRAEPRFVEVQVRTVLQHMWADTVERTSGHLGVNYKRDGGSPIQVVFQCLARVLDRADRGLEVDAALLDEYETLRLRAFPENGLTS